VDERDVLLAWRNLFHGNEPTGETLAKAEALLEGLTGESPLHLRLANELEELKKGPARRNKTRAVRSDIT
jgi:hypothetical protein